jgi:ribonuclease D
VHFLTNKEEIVDRFVHELDSANQIAIDTESIVGKTKLDKQKDESPSIIQVAFASSVYIIDCSNCHIKVKDAMLRYLSSDKLLLGHAL